MRRFEWDDEKEEANWRKHGIRFDQAASVFGDPRSFSEPDNRFEHGEERWRTIGMAEGRCLMLFVAHTTHENGMEVIRIISARRANRKERKLYGNRKF